MIGAWPFLALGLLLLVLVILLLRRPMTSGLDSADSSEEQETQAALDAESFPRQLVDGLFGSEDWKFVAKQGSPRVRRLFLQQRTALALSWLRAARANATRLIRVHSAAARKNSRLEPLVELRVIADYLVFQMLCQMIAAVIWFRGPVTMRRLVAYADGLSERLFEVITGVFPARLASGNSKRAPARPRAPSQRGG
jgi:hypothetical protein